MIKQGVLKGKSEANRIAFRKLRLERKKGFRVRASFMVSNALFNGQMNLEYSYGEISPGRRHWYVVNLSPSEAKKIIEVLEARLNGLDSLVVYNCSEEG